MDNLDFPEGMPVTKAESLNLNIGQKQQSIADVYLNPQSDHNVNVNGPFEQTLFLGCSIVNFNVNLGWGGENSTLTVTLVEDDAYHWNDPLSQYNTQIMRDTLTRPASFDGHATNPGVGDTRPGLNTIQGNTNQSLNTNEFPGKVGPTGYDLSSFGPTMFPDIPKGQDTRRDWFRGIYDKEIRLDAERKAEQAVLKDPRLARGDFGKVYYKLGLDGAWLKQYWTKPDPGFVGHAYDILGTAVRFIFHGFEFAGLVSSWKKNAGQGGYNQYTVEIKSFATLLSNTQLIIDHYAGSIFTRLPESDSKQPVVFDAIEGLGLPSNDIGDKKGKNNSTDWIQSIAGEASKVSDYEKKYVGNISQGNLTNVFNIYGYMESVVGFGKHDVNELGTKIEHIYAGIQDLISYTPRYDADTGFHIGRMDTRFSPYGRIVGKSPALTKLGELSTTIESGTFNVIYLRDTYQIIEPSQAQVLTVIEKSFNSPTPPYYYQELYSPGVAHRIPYTLRDAGCIPTKESVDGIYRQHYTIDLGELPPIPDDARIKGPVISITDLVDNVCSQANYDWFVDFDYPNNKIKIRTISRQNQPANNYIEHLLLSAAGSANITAYDYGKEFNDSSTVRSMYIGAKQKRLLQVNSNFLANKTNSLVFDPYDDEGKGSLLFYKISDIVNSVRIPDHFSTRNLTHPYYTEIFFAGLENYSSGTGAVIWEPYYRNSWYDWGGERERCGLGNYLDPIVYEGPNYDSTDEKGDTFDIFSDLGNLMYNRYSYLPYDQKNGVDTVVERIDKESKIISRPDPHFYKNYPLWDEFICPYFGLDSDGNARKVFYDQAMRQIQVLCSIGDLQNILGFRLTSAIDIGSGNVTETAWSSPYATGGSAPNPTSPVPTTGAISYGQAVGSNLSSGSTFKERNISWNLSKRDFYDYDAKFLVTENEIRSAIASFDSWMTYTFNKEFTTDLGQMLRKTIFAQSGSLVQRSTSQVDENDRINTGRDYPVSVVFNGSNAGITAGSSSESPNTSESDIMKDKIKSTLEGAFNYVKELGSYYGKQYMVKVPGVSISRSRTMPTGTNMQIKFGNQTHEVDKYEIGGEYYTSYKPATDGAWEEIGNLIDDTIVIGSITGDFFREADGRYGPMLGFNGSYEYLSDTIKEELFVLSRGDDQGGNAVNLITGDFAGSPNYSSAPTGVSTAGQTPKQIRGAYLGNGNFGSIRTETPQAAISTTAMLFATSSQPATGTDIIPNDWYSSINTSLDDTECLYYNYNPPNSPISYNMPSFAKVEDIKLSSHKKEVPENLRFKFYARASLEDNFVFINAIGADKKSALRERAEGKELRAILKLGSEVVANPVHLVDKFVGHALQLDCALFRKEGCTVPVDIAGTTQIKVYKKVQAPISPKQIKQILLSKVNSPNLVTTTEILQQDSDYSAYYGTLNGGLLPFKGGFGVGNGLDVLKVATDHLLKSVNASFSSEENKALTMPIAPKAVMPGFAAVPLESQTAVYGPWTNQPYLLRNEIFTDEDLKTQPEALIFSIENLVGGLKVEVAEDLAPWRYGGMAALDAAVITKIQNDAAYQLQIEQGTMDIPGAPSYKLGDFLNAAAGAAGGPIINNISANIDSGGITTKYSFRTFSKKFSMYNKENADRLAKINTESIKRRKDIAMRSAAVTNNRARNIKRRNLNNYGNVDYVNPPIAASWRSASDLLIGHNEVNIRLPNTESESSLEKVALASGVLAVFDYDLGWGFRPKAGVDEKKANIHNVVDFPKMFSHSKILDSREASRILSADYENQACMSLDGLLSPISFYPTQNFSTYHITKYERSKCRYCLGKGVVSYPDSAANVSLSVFPNKEENEEQATDEDSYVSSSQMLDMSYDKTKSTTKTMPCPFCESMLTKISGIATSTKGGKADPPYVVATGVDAVNPSGFIIKDNKIIFDAHTRGTVINHTTLNPIVMSHGEFSIFQNRQSGDFTGHSIKMVGVGSVPPAGPNDSLSQATCGDNRLVKSFLEYDQLYIDKVKELYNIPADKRTKTIQAIIDEIGTENPAPFANNSRFFGFRGPMMLHGWGYDTEGYPVPNASGDYAYTKDPKDEDLPEFGKKPIKVKVKETGEEKYIFKNQRFVKKEDIDSDVVDKLDVEWVTLESVDLPGTTETYSGEGYFTEPYKENHFAKGWAQVPSTWPVGPIDLRWDEKARVWTVPSTYRNVYVLLEEDLRDNIARGEIIDNSTKTDTSVFGAGYRKMVLVRDTHGVYAAPRSSLIYCAYDTESGYYEPISQSSFTTSGVIIGANSASMYRVFKKKIKNVANNNIQNNDEQNQFIATFTNPLDIAIDAGDTALFTYLPDGWIVQSSRG